MAFFLGVNGLLVGTFFLGAVLVSGQRPADLFEADYQNTPAFRETVADYLDAVINLAEDDGGYLRFPLRDGLSSMDAETALKCLQEDKNLLFAIRGPDGLIRASNAGDHILSGPSSLPSGYNLHVCYNGARVAITKDGAELDIYGDGYYSGGEMQWRVPGYSNRERQSAFTVTLAVAQTPTLYEGNLQASTLYWLRQDLLAGRSRCMAGAALAAAGLALLVLSALWHEARGTARRAIAHWTSRVWMEVKLAALLGVCCVLLYVPVNLRGFTWLFWRYTQTAALSSYDLLAVWLVVGGLLALLWALYFLANDLRYHHKTWWHGLCSRVLSHLGRGLRALWQSLSGRELKYPVQRRLARAAWADFACDLPFVGFTCLFCLLFFLNAWGSSESYRVFLLLLLLVPGGLIALKVLLLRRRLADAGDLGSLADQMAAVRSGDLSGDLALPHEAGLRRLAEDLGDIQQGMRAALARQMESERMKVELVANVSHDLKTPLTSVVSYAELLSRETNLPDHVTDYIRILNDKAQRLSAMVRDVFEVSKAASGDLSLRSETLDLGKLLRQTLAEMEGPIAESGLVFRADLPDAPVYIVADGDRLYRVFQNLLENALQYSLEGSRVYLTLTARVGTATASLKNTSKTELPRGRDFTARFVRGDESRTDGGSGLGLAIASSFTASCGGTFRAVADADLFTAEVTFPLAEAPAETLEDPNKALTDGVCPVAPDLSGATGRAEDANPL